MKQPLTYEEMLLCEVVVLARYKSHEPQSLTITVESILRGTEIAEGDQIKVDLKHNYCMSTRPPYFFSSMPTDEDGVPRLCYKKQLMNPGDLIPVPVVEDVREPLIYFLPLANEPALERRLQVQSQELISGWREALNGQQPNLAFRLLQPNDSFLARDALEELAITRDPDMIDLLFERLQEKDPYELRKPYFSFDALITIGDVEGDVYGQAKAILTSSDPQDLQYAIKSRAAQIMALTRPEQAWRDFTALLGHAPEPVRRAVVSGLGYIKSRESADLLVDLLDEEDLSKNAAWSLKALTEDPSCCTTPAQRSPQDLMPYILRELGPILSANDSSLDPHRTLSGYFGGYFDNDPHEMGSTAKEEARRNIRKQYTTSNWKSLARRQEVDLHRLKQFVPSVRELEDQVDRSIESQSYAGSTEAVRALLLLRAPEAQTKLTNLLASRKHMRDSDRCWLLATAVRHGRPYYLKELATVSETLLENDSSYAALKALLFSDHPEMLNRYVDYVLHSNRMKLNVLGFVSLDAEITSAVSSLFPEHVPEFFECLVSLLEAPTMEEREAGSKILLRELYWDFDFLPLALKATREESLREIKPLMDSLQELSEPDLRAEILRLHEVRLDEGRPSKSWLPALVQASQSYDNTVAKNALWMIGHLTDRQNLESVAVIPAPYREVFLVEELGDDLPQE